MKCISPPPPLPTKHSESCTFIVRKVSCVFVWWEATRECEAAGSYSASGLSQWCGRGSQGWSLLWCSVPSGATSQWSSEPSSPHVPAGQGTGILNIIKPYNNRHRHNRERSLSPLLLPRPTSPVSGGDHSALQACYPAIGISHWDTQCLLHKNIQPFALMERHIDNDGLNQ